MTQDAITAYWQPIVSGYLSGHTALPLSLGLTEAEYQVIAEACGMVDMFPADLQSLQLRGELLRLRRDEMNELSRLLHDYLQPQTQFGVQMITVLSCACMGGQHLWRDLAMPERPRLTDLFGYYFPALRQLNVNNMRWKRFLYRQLCERGGDYVCRAPSCGECSSYGECFEVAG
ncbi:nitrogen fixation protein NifQ [Vibrio mangrovi]|uniref:NifQ n=1 Tax=Vibrio mangrovi TaxID=474394 RepID=A0A1Y6IT35_9VIBR|nr:nitrogen fixation protein NifQ [Vibrio mangrovi]MDW6003963.1 nitrogen fixation protein NifQ [Vibrio mangrovi]SMR99243.1 NifQ [Vibrio mangrovi]